MMTIDECIEYHKGVAENLYRDAYNADHQGSKPTKWGRGLRETADNNKQEADWLRELKERRESDRWISVGERLPEPRIDVWEILTWDKWSDIMTKR